ncbi:hypothetical protein D3C86_1481550 [compost metagenome]
MLHGLVIETAQRTRHAAVLFFEDEANEPVFVGHHLRDLHERRRDHSAHPCNAAFSACFGDLGCRGHAGSNRVIAEPVGGLVGPSKELRGLNDGIPRNDAIDVAQLDFAAQPLRGHEAVLMALLVAAKELATLTHAHLERARVPGLEHRPSSEPAKVETVELHLGDIDLAAVIDAKP